MVILLFKKKATTAPTNDHYQSKSHLRQLSTVDQCLFTLLALPGGFFKAKLTLFCGILQFV